MNRVDFSLYLIADVGQIKENLISSVKMAIDGGVKAVQLRGKDLPARELLKIGERLRHLTSMSRVFQLTMRMERVMISRLRSGNNANHRF